MPPSSLPAPLMLSVSGARGIIGASMTPNVASDFAAAFGSIIREDHPHLPSPLIILGRDSRPSGEMIQCAAVAGLLSVGCSVLRLGIVTTPTVGVMIDRLRAEGAAGGLVITASHNPVIWNGLKCLAADGAAPPPRQARRIIDRFNSKQFALVPVDRIGSASRSPDASRIHVDRVLANVDVPAIRACRFKVALDSVNGAGGPPAALLLAALGCSIHHINAEPTGLFTHPPEPTRQHLTDLCKAVRDFGAHVGFAQDPDADRLAIVDEQGTYIGEEYTLVLGSLAALQELHHTTTPSDSPQSAAPTPSAGTPSAGTPSAGVTLAANLSTSRMIDDLAQRFGATVLRTAVGEANVVHAMRAHHSLIGGEGNGGIIWPRICFIRDSLSGMALTLQLMARNQQSLSTICSSIPAYAIEKAKIDLTPGISIPPVLDRLARHFAGPSVTANSIDGLRLDFADRRAWLHVRPSNTEPIIRIIAEAPTPDAARSLIAEATPIIQAR